MAQKPEKEMRRIPEKGQVPTDKESLIKYLTERITQAENNIPKEALEDTEELLEKERAKRKKVSDSLRERSTQLNNLLELDKKSLPEKIKERLQQILTEAITAKLAVQGELETSNKLNYECKQMMTELKQVEAQEGMEQEILQDKDEKLKEETRVLENSIKKTEQNIKDLEGDVSMLKQKKEEVENKYMQLRVAVDRMSVKKLKSIAINY